MPPAYPANAQVAVAHVTPSGEPCAFANAEAYDLETHTIVVTEDVLWKLDDSSPPPATDMPDELETPPTEAQSPPAQPAKPAKRRKKAPRGKTQADDVDDWTP